jgi:hypothetical protein
MDGVWGRACFNALLGGKRQVQLARNLSPANNRPLDCRLADAQPARRLRSTHSQLLYRPITQHTSGRLIKSCRSESSR